MRKTRRKIIREEVRQWRKGEKCSGSFLGNQYGWWGCISPGKYENLHHFKEQSQEWSSKLERDWRAGGAKSQRTREGATLTAEVRKEQRAVGMWRDNGEEKIHIRWPCSLPWMCWQSLQPRTKVHSIFRCLRESRIFQNNLDVPFILN